MNLHLFFAENIFLLFYLFAIQNFNPHWKRSCHHLLLHSYRHGTLQARAAVHQVQHSTCQYVCFALQDDPRAPQSQLMGAGEHFDDDPDRSVRRRRVSQRYNQGLLPRDNMLIHVNNLGLQRPIHSSLTL